MTARQKRVSSRKKIAKDWSPIPGLQPPESRDPLKGIAITILAVVLGIVILWVVMASV